MIIRHRVGEGKGKSDVGCERGREYHTWGERGAGNI